MARGWHYTKLSILSSALFLYFSGMCFVLIFLYFCGFRFCFCFVFVFVLSLELCSADRVPDWQPRILLGSIWLRPDRLM